jgi:amino acid transporter
VDRPRAPRFKTPVSALLAGVVVTVLFMLLVFPSPDHNVHVWFITYPANVNALVALVSFGVSGIYLSFLLTVVAWIVARSRGWIAEGSFQLGRWAWPVGIAAAACLALMFVNVTYPSGLASPRALDWITLSVMVVIGGRGRRLLRDCAAGPRHRPPRARRARADGGRTRSSACPAALTPPRSRPQAVRSATASPRPLSVTCMPRPGQSEPVRLRT